MPAENMTLSQRETKNAKIKQTMQQTRARRKTQTAKVFQLKIDASHLNKKQHEALHMLFIEAKWLKNHILSLNDINDYKESKTVDVKLPDNTFETRKFKFIGSQMKQSVFNQVKSDIKALAASKSRGRKVGKLKFVSQVTSVDLKQFGNTYKFSQDGKRARIQNIPGYVRISGYEQLKGYELANAKLIQKPSGFYLFVTAFKDTSLIKDEYVSDNVIGIDFGVNKSIVLSNGDTFNAYVGESDRLRRLQKKLNRQQKGSNGYVKTCHLIKREYEKMDNLKDEYANQIVSYVMSLAETVYFQDEMIGSWKKQFGKRIHHSILGRVKEKLKRHDRAFMVSRSSATTKTCVCGKRNDIGLSRVYRCDCGYVADRDIHAASMMIVFGEEQHDKSHVNTCGTQGFQAGGVDVRRNHLIEMGLLSTVKPEASTSSASR